MRKLIVYLILALAVVVFGHAMAGTIGFKSFTSDAGYRFTGNGPSAFCNAASDGVVTVHVFVITATDTLPKPQQGDMHFTVRPGIPLDVFIAGMDSVYVDLGSGASYCDMVWGD